MQDILSTLIQATTALVVILCCLFPLYFVIKGIAFFDKGELIKENDALKNEIKGLRKAIKDIKGDE